MCVYVMMYVCVVWVCLKHICGPCVHACQWVCVSRYLQLWSNSVFGSLSLCLLNTLQNAAAVAIKIKGPLVEDTCGNSRLPNHTPTGLKITDNRLCVSAYQQRKKQVCMYLKRQ